ncbi:MAG: MFS transporter, partial [Phycisphaerales bacterium]
MMSNRVYKWAVVVMLWLVCFFNYADRQSIYSVFSMLEKDPGLQLTAVQLGYVASSFMWVYAGAGWFAGLVGDRFRRKTVVLAGFFFWSVVTLAFSFATRYWHIVTLRAIEGLGEAFYFPAAMALISAYHGKDTRSRAMGIHQSSVYIGTVAGGTLGGAMGERFGWRSSFTLLGLVGIALGLVLLVCLKEPKEESRTKPRRRESPGEIL